MKKGRLKKHLLALLLLCAVTFVLGACGGKDPAGSGSVTNQGTSNGAGSDSTVKISRADYIGVIGKVFGYDNYETESAFFADVTSGNKNYNCVQACAEWEVIPTGGNFEPDKEATLEFALATAVRAIGIDDLGLDTSSSDKALADYYVSNIAQLDTSNLSNGITENTGKQIAQYAMEYGHKIEFPQVINMEYNEGVKVADSKIVIPISGTTGTLKDGHDYKVGDIVYIEESPSGYPMGIKIKSIDGNKFTYEEASVDDVFAQLEISGTFDGEIVNVFSASDNVSVLGEENYYPQARAGYEFAPAGTGVKTDFGSDHAIFAVNVSKGDSNAEFKFGIKNIKVTADYKHGATKLNPKSVRFNLTYDTFSEINADFHTSMTIPLGQIDIRIYGPFFARVSLTANVGADGEIHIDYNIHNTAEMKWEKGKGISKSFNSETSSSVEGQITLTAELTLLAELRIDWWPSGSKGIANVQATTGLVVIAKGEADLLGKGPACIDVFGYVPLRWGVNQKGCALTKFSSKLKADGVIWDSTNSKITFHCHWENGKRTPDDKCTRGEGEEVVQETENPDGSPLDEYEIFDFEPISFDFIELKEYITFIDQNKQYEVKFDSIPEGYTKESLKYTVEDPSVCSVSAGTITGLKAGSTLVKISTSDGMFSVTFVVIVNEDYSLEGGFQEL